MKKLILITAMIVWTGISYAQTEEVKDPAKPVNSQINENAAKGQEISNMGTTLEGGKEKGMSISSAARRSTLMRERAAKGAENSAAGRERSGMGAENAAAGRERAAMGAENAEKGRSMSNQVRPSSQMRPEVPAQARPNVTVPQSRPNAPVVRPNSPAPNRPTPPAGRPTGLPGGGI
ncbi:hypothetical protein [Cecembia rubra]|nr:hypothetical protein [Cecembia rubra]